MNTELNAAQFCGEYARESDCGRITFSYRVVVTFFTEYTHLKPADFDKEARKRLVIFVMIDLYNDAIRSIVKDNSPKEKIELPEIIFK
jgi:hypothetical protein